MKFLECTTDEAKEVIEKALLENDFAVWEKGNMRRIYVNFRRGCLDIVFNMHISRSNSGWMCLSDDDGEKCIANGKANKYFDDPKIFFDLVDGTWNVKDGYGDEYEEGGLLAGYIRDEFDPRCVEKAA